ncbi:hypothetical protein PVIIG_06076 [Plasmodium vivax India VII]|uniref:Variable surface protein Vir21 n=1 Tax=Plasmodium vivax India VII TaxID=1077284 RepID=A0A0J9S2P3_PLAVI|nr:hypothetical protein PVIIG_06076 [Plasmodium vivax India VII]
MSNDKEYILDEIKYNYNVIGKSKFYEIYEVFYKSCYDFVDGYKSCYTGSTNSWAKSVYVIDILKNLYSNLYRIYDSITGTNNTYFENISSEDEKMCCVSLKYWLYDQIIIESLEETDINAIFTGWETYLKGKIKNRSTDLCIFNKLKKDEINMIKNIYALYTVLYDNNDEFETCNDDTCKYLEYFGKGLDEFISSINSCSSNSNMTNYCNEFNEFIEMCKIDNEYAGISIYEEITKSKADEAGKYLLYYKKYKDKPLYIYLKDEKLLNFVKTSDFLSNKNSTDVSATSVVGSAVGSAIGVSSIFYYLYRVIINDIFKYKYFAIINIK